MNNVKQMFQIVKNSSDPRAMLNKIIHHNPQLKEIMDLAGSDPKTAFYRLAEQKGVNPDDILNMLK